MNRATLRGLLAILLVSFLLFLLIYAVIFIPRYQSLQQNERALSATAKLQKFIVEGLGESFFENELDIIEMPEELQTFFTQKMRKLTETQPLPAYMESWDDLQIYVSNEAEENAYAVPGGTIVFTVAEILSADNLAEIVAVLAHELGHVIYEHISRNLLLRVSGLTLTAWLTSANGIAMILNEIPNMSFSRELEREADQFAIETLEKAGISPMYLADALKKNNSFINSSKIDDTSLENSKNTDEEKTLPDFLSTHPSTKERIEIIQSAAIDYELKREEAVPLDPNFGMDWPALQEELRTQSETKNETIE